MSSSLKLDRTHQPDAYVAQFGPRLPEPASSFYWSPFTAIQGSEAGAVLAFY